MNPAEIKFLVTKYYSQIFVKFYFNVIVCMQTGSLSIDHQILWDLKYTKNVNYTFLMLFINIELSIKELGGWVLVLNY